ncbi:hypothetical protein VTN31DRAFT_2315 [Thermomyces dupontii]|uniref:uncharacterized protein n=1 Tax=Talaromyces thermophilus TaxID=28565 RepID=UPI0037442330
MDGACDPKENLPGHPLSEGEQGSLILDCLVGPFAIELRRSTVAASGLIVGQELVPVSVNCQDFENERIEKKKNKNTSSVHQSDCYL